MAVVEFSHVVKRFESRGGETVVAVDDVSLEVSPGETLALIGESGSGKSTVGRLAIGLLRPTSGTVTVDGVDLGGLSARELRAMRSRISMVFQEPYESLNPRMTVGDIVGEPLAIHQRDLTSRERARRVHAMLESVGLGSQFYARRPRALSGGQQQRVGIARAMITGPHLVVLDEPTSSLDLSIRVQTLKLLKSLQAGSQTAYLFISHDLATVGYIGDRVTVMLNGRAVESGSVESVLENPRDSYTQRLLEASLSVEPAAS